MKSEKVGLKIAGLVSRFAHGFFLDWLVIAMWALWIGRSYLDMGLNMWPNNGQEYIMSMQNQYIWTILPKCGACFFWNGFIDGGAPSFIDVHGAWLHPISIFATYLFGVFNSGKVIVIASLFMAGIGQWWLGKVLKLSRLSRLWTALILVASGALTGRMEIGSIPLILSTAACILVIPPAIDLALHGSKRIAIGLGITLGLAVLSGQGYLQIGLMISLIPMILILLLETKPDDAFHIKPTWKYFLFAVILGWLIAAPLLVPVAHHYSILGKDTDPTFASAQPINFNLLNLVINDNQFFRTDALGKSPYPYLNVNYIGWLPVMFAVIGTFLGWREYRKVTTGIIVATALVYLASSAEIFKWLSLFSLGDFVSGIRNPSPIQGLAVPLILALSGIGVDGLVKHEWPQIGIGFFKTDQKLGSMRMGVKWIVMIFLMAFSLSSVSEFSQNWLFVASTDLNTNVLIQPLKTSDAQWVQPPYGEYIWLPAAIENGMKIRGFFRPWRLANPEMPKAFLEMSNIQDDVKLPEFLETYMGYVILKRPDNLYAYVKSGEDIYACKANSIGGFIDVSCNANISGTLSVVESATQGWTATRDGQNISLYSKPWLTVDAPAGKHNYKFRYTPWDAPVGILLSIIGWIIAFIGLLHFSKKKSVPQDGVASNY